MTGLRARRLLGAALNLASEAAQAALAYPVNVFAGIVLDAVADEAEDVNRELERDDSEAPLEVLTERLRIARSIFELAR